MNMSCIFYKALFVLANHLPNKTSRWRPLILIKWVVQGVVMGPDTVHMQLG